MAEQVLSYDPVSVRLTVKSVRSGRVRPGSRPRKAFKSVKLAEIDVYDTALIYGRGESSVKT